MTTPKPPVLFFLSLTLQDDLREQEEATVAAIEWLRGSVTGILLGLPSWQQEPGALHHQLVVDARMACHAAGIDIYHGRDLFSRWGPTAEIQRRSDVFNPAYYAAYLRGLGAEARAIGAAGTFAYCEPHGDSPFQEWFKKTGFSRLDRWRVKGAIERALRVAPPTTLAYPAGGKQSSQFGWMLRRLGEQNLHHKPFKLRNPSRLHMTPPRRERIELDWWGSWLTTVDGGGFGPLLVREWRNLDFHAIQAAYPECRGFWVYAARGEDGNERAQVMVEMGRE